MTDTFWSAPGKAFLVGGYLVLDPQYAAYVTALSARIFAKASFTRSDTHTVTLDAVSPQFTDKWRFAFDAASSQVTNSGPSQNPFLAAVLAVVCSYLRVASGHIALEIYSDAAFNSQPAHALPRLKQRFPHYGVPLSAVPKTGLGSSAALTSAVTAALYSCLTGQERLEDLHTVHKLAQIAHCAAQKKVGSGFDVASACFGSIKYRRFPAATIAQATDLQTPNYAAVLRATVDSEWPMLVEPVALPADLQLLMGDVNGGSETPKMVAQLMKWKADNGETSGAVWGALAAANSQAIGLIESHTPGAGTAELARALQQIRAQQQKLTRLANVPIEPDSQTQLLDRCAAIDGVVGGVVPGAGGYDAICLLVKKDAVEDVISRAAGLPVSWLSVREDHDGLVRGEIA